MARSNFPRRFLFASPAGPPTGTAGRRGGRVHLTDLDGRIVGTQSELGYDQTADGLSATVTFAGLNWGRL